MILIITSCITPPKQSNLKLIDSKKRYDETIKSLEYIEATHCFDKIVLCDNSSFDFDKKRMIESAMLHNVKLEILSFYTDPKFIKSRGKGYGEGEIMKYVINNSVLLKSESYFFKLTGKLYIENISKVIEKINSDTNYFNIVALKWFGAIDTRFYAIKKIDYINILLETYKEVDDKKNMWYEICFRNALKKTKLRFHCFPIYPIYRGLSGTNGLEYKTNDIIAKCHQLLTKCRIHNSFLGSFFLYITLKISHIFKL